MITYKEFEVIRTMLKINPTDQNLAAEVYNNKHYYVFKSKEEVEELIASLEKKGYVENGTVTKSAMIACSIFNCLSLSSIFFLLLALTRFEC